MRPSRHKTTRKTSPPNFYPNSPSSTPPSTSTSSSPGCCSSSPKAASPPDAPPSSPTSPTNSSTPTAPSSSKPPRPTTTRRLSLTSPAPIATGPTPNLLLQVTTPLQVTPSCLGSHRPPRPQARLTANAHDAPLPSPFSSIRSQGRACPARSVILRL